MTSTFTAQAVARIREAAAQNRLVRGTWQTTSDSGLELVCLLAAASPECAANHRASACPTEVMPQWLANYAVWYFDKDARPLNESALDFASRLEQSVDFTAPQWRLFEVRVRLSAVRVALPHAGTSADAVQCVIDLCERELAGNPPTKEEWRSARWATSWAASGATEAASRSTEAASWAARWATSWAASGATEAARNAASLAAEAAEAASSAEIISGFLAAWDKTIMGMEA